MFLKKLAKYAYPPTVAICKSNDYYRTNMNTVSKFVDDAKGYLGSS